MKATIFAAALLCAVASSAAAEDNQAGTPLTPADAGPWTLESGGHDLCVVTLSAARSGAGYGVTAPASCGAELPAGIAAWATTPTGMKLVDAQGATVVGFSRWSNSLLVSRRASGVDLHLRRGAGS